MALFLPIFLPLIIRWVIKVSIIVCKSSAALSRLFTISFLSIIFVAFVLVFGANFVHGLLIAVIILIAIFFLAVLGLHLLTRHLLTVQLVLLLFSFLLFLILHPTFILFLLIHKLVLLHHSLKVLEDHLAGKETANQGLHLNDGDQRAFIYLNAIFVIIFFIVNVFLIIGVDDISFVLHLVILVVILHVIVCVLLLVLMLLFIGSDHHHCTLLVVTDIVNVSMMFFVSVLHGRSTGIVHFRSS